MLGDIFHRAINGLQDFLGITSPETMSAVDKRDQFVRPADIVVASVKLTVLKLGNNAIFAQHTGRRARCPRFNSWNWPMELLFEQQRKEVVQIESPHDPSVDALVDVSDVLDLIGSQFWQGIPDCLSRENRLRRPESKRYPPVQVNFGRNDLKGSWHIGPSSFRPGCFGGLMLLRFG